MTAIRTGSLRSEGRNVGTCYGTKERILEPSWSGKKKKEAQYSLSGERKVKEGNW